MFKKNILIFVFMLTICVNNAHAYVSLKLDNVPFFDEVSLSNLYSFAQEKEKNFIFIFNSKKQVIYIKHKNLDNTFKISLNNLEKDSKSSIVKDFKTNMLIQSYPSKLYDIKADNKNCYQIYGSKDLSESLNAGVFNIFAIYKAFVYMTGQFMLDNKCDNISFSAYNNKNIGAPLALFYKENQYKISKIINHDKGFEQIVENYNVDFKNAIKPDLNLQYELLFTLLDSSNKKLLKDQFYKLPITYKIKAIEKLLENQ